MIRKIFTTREFNQLILERHRGRCLSASHEPVVLSIGTLGSGALFDHRCSGQQTFETAGCNPTAPSTDVRCARYRVPTAMTRESAFPAESMAGLSSRNAAQTANLSRQAHHPPVRAICGSDDPTARARRRLRTRTFSTAGHPVCASAKHQLLMMPLIPPVRRGLSTARQRNFHTMEFNRFKEESEPLKIHVRPFMVRHTGHGATLKLEHKTVLQTSHVVFSDSRSPPPSISSPDGHAT